MGHSGGSCGNGAELFCYLLEHRNPDMAGRNYNPFTGWRFGRGGRSSPIFEGVMIADVAQADFAAETCSLEEGGLKGRFYFETMAPFYRIHQWGFDILLNIDLSSLLLILEF